MRPAIYVTPSGRASPQLRVARVIAAAEHLRVSLRPPMADRRGR